MRMVSGRGCAAPRGVVVKSSMQNRYRSLLTTLETMTLDATPDATPDEGDSRAAADKGHIRNSSLMLVGRVVAMVLNLLVQIVTVRYLSRAGYGSFAYVMAIVGLGSSFVMFGQNKALSRFLPTYEETDRPRQARGSILVAFSTVFVLGASAIATVLGLQLIAGIELVDDQTAREILLILIALAPVQALDTLLMELSAVVGQVKTIFVRRYLLTPGVTTRFGTAGRGCLGWRDHVGVGLPRVGVARVAGVCGHVAKGAPSLEQVGTGCRRADTGDAVLRFSDVHQRHGALAARDHRRFVDRGPAHR